MSDRYQTIIVSSNPQGRRVTGKLSGTAKPGTCHTVKAATEPENGRFTYEPYNRAGDGDQAPIAVLLEDLLSGKLVSTAGVSGDYREFYYPEPGDLLQMRLQNVAGTGDTFAIGDELMVDDGTGTLIAATGEEANPFNVRETVGTALTADTLVLVEFTGY